jgi:leucine-rich repeat-containing protein 49
VKKEILKNTCVEGGHAEIEDETILFIYGNAYEIVLSNPTFQESIEKIQFQYILFDFIIDTNTLQNLKNFRKLKEIILKDNYVNSLL